jgi:hypothetical protein
VVKNKQTSQQVLDGVFDPVEISSLSRESVDSKHYSKIGKTYVSMWLKTNKQTI